MISGRQKKTAAHHRERNIALRILPRATGSSWNRLGYSLLELVIGLSAAVVLMGGMASAVVVSSRSMSVSSGGAGARAAATDVQRDLMADLQRATGFTERTANAVTFTVPDRTGDGVPEKLRYAWTGTAGDPLTLQMNGGTVRNIATNVQQFSLDYLTKNVIAPVVPDETMQKTAKLLYVSAGTLSQLTFQQKLNGQQSMVMSTASESPQIALFQSWGFTVSVISATQPSTDFDTAIAQNDVIFMSSEPEVVLALPYVLNTTKGVVNEEPTLAPRFGFYTGSGATSGNSIRVATNSHYITKDFTAGQSVTLTSSPVTLQSFPLTRPPKISLLGVNETNYQVSFATLAAGWTGANGTTIMGRRAQLPWAQSSFDSSLLTQNGQNLLKATLEWAAGSGTDGDPSLLHIGLDTLAGNPNGINNKSTSPKATPITMTTKGQMLELSTYIDARNSPFKLGLYSDAGGKPGNLLAQTGLLTGGKTWITGTIPPVTLNPGNYWLAIAVSTNNQQIFRTTPTNISTSEITNVPITSAFPNLWANGSGTGSPLVYSGTQLVIYGSYIPLQ